MVKVQKSFNQVNNPTSTWQKNNHGLNFLIFLTRNGKQKCHVDIYCKESYPKNNTDTEFLINHAIWSMDYVRTDS